MLLLTFYKNQAVHVDEQGKFYCPALNIESESLQSLKKSIDISVDNKYAGMKVWVSKSEFNGSEETQFVLAEVEGLRPFGQVLVNWNGRFEPVYPTALYADTLDNIELLNKIESLGQKVKTTQEEIRNLFDHLQAAGVFTSG